MKMGYFGKNLKTFNIIKIIFRDTSPYCVGHVSDTVKRRQFERYRINFSGRDALLVLL